MSGAGPDFTPSVNGFRFTNSFPPVPLIRLDLGVAGEVGLGDASQGVCGGMVFAALDYWHADGTSPAAQPAARSPPDRFLVQRIVAPRHVPGGIDHSSQAAGPPAAHTPYPASRRHIVVVLRRAWRSSATPAPPHG